MKMFTHKLMNMFACFASQAVVPGMNVCGSLRYNKSSISNRHDDELHEHLKNGVWLKALRALSSDCDPHENDKKSTSADIVF